MEAPAGLENRDILSKLCERALLIGVNQPDEHHSRLHAHLEELNALVLSLGIPTQGSLTTTLRGVHPRYLLGRGKVEEVASRIHSERIDLVIFDCDLSPVQQRNLEKEWQIAVIDRREVILDIFAERASTREAMLQVSLARMQYSLPRLTRAWTHLSRQRGGARGTRGKGETQLESDRRLILNRITRLKSDLEKVREQRNTRRRKRQKRPVCSVSLVGYTNAGKSSLLNMMSGAELLVEDKLFATLDPSTRQVKLPGGWEIVMTDTVGFIRKLPHDLVDAFRSTLEEALFADVILHVIDAGDEELNEHLAVTEKVLRELGTGDKTVIRVLNKADTLSPGVLEALRLHYPDAVAVSARTGAGREDLYKHLGRALNASRPVVNILLPPDRWDLRSKLHRESTVLNEDFDEMGLHLTARLNSADRGRLSAFVIDQGSES